MFASSNIIGLFQFLSSAYTFSVRKSVTTSTRISASLDWMLVCPSNILHTTVLPRMFPGVLTGFFPVTLEGSKNCSKATQNLCNPCGHSM